VEERFIELLTKKLSDEISDAELKEFELLLINDDACRQQYNFFKAYWIPDEEQYSNSDLMFQRIKKRIGFQEELVEISEDPDRFYRRRVFWRNIAAVLLVAIGLSVVFYYQYASKKNPKTNLELVKTPSRSKSKIVLSDGSIVTLNAETVLKYPASFDGATREVYLSGEAFFDVAKDHQHPFIVHAGKMSIKVVGTAFNVKSYDNDKQSETTLIRGAIEVTLLDRPADRFILKPHEKLIIQSTILKKPISSKRLRTITPDSVKTNYALTNLTYLKSNDTTIVETSWVNNRLIFKDEPFDVIANQMERWYGVKVKFKNSIPKDYRFTGVFEKETISQALDALKLIEPFNYKYKNETIFIY